MTSESEQQQRVEALAFEIRDMCVGQNFSVVVAAFMSNLIPILDTCQSKERSIETAEYLEKMLADYRKGKMA